MKDYSFRYFETTCTSCKEKVKLFAGARSTYFTCQNCLAYQTFFDADSKVLFQLNKTPQNHSLFLEQKCKFDRIEYILIAVCKKNEVGTNYTWWEYTLFNAEYGYKYLVEYNGHWLLVNPILFYGIDYSPSTITLHKDLESFNIHSKYNCKTIYAIGEFDTHVLSNSSYSVKEFLRHGKTLNLEADYNAYNWSEGVYLTRKEIAKAFNINVSKLPVSFGEFGAQKSFFYIDKLNLYLLTIISIVLLTIGYLFYLNQCSQKVILIDTFSIMNESQQVAVTKPFVLKDKKQAIEVVLTSPVNNDWFAAGFNIVNEETGLNLDFDLEVAYYSGRDTDGAWTEGTTRKGFVIPNMEPGTYHINIFSYKKTKSNFQIQVIEDKPLHWNFIISLLVILLISFIIGTINSNYLENKWSD